VAPGASTGLSSSVADRGSFFAPISFRGAFDQFNWMKGWTHADEIGVFAGNSVVVPNVTLKRSGGNVVASFNTETGVKYVVEVSSDNKTFNPLNQVIEGNNASKDINLGQSGLLFVRVTPQ
jgi:hypothetical protein